MLTTCSMLIPSFLTDPSLPECGELWGFRVGPSVDGSAAHGGDVRAGGLHGFLDEAVQGKVAVHLHVGAQVVQVQRVWIFKKRKGKMC